MTITITNTKHRKLNIVRHADGIVIHELIQYDARRTWAIHLVRVTDRELKAIAGKAAKLRAVKGV